MDRYRSVSVFCVFDARRSNLRGGAFVTSANKFRDEPEAFDVDRLTLDMRTDTVTFLATYGITPHRRGSRGAVRALGDRW